MSVTIKDGNTGNTAEVDSGNRLRVFSVSEPGDFHVNKDGRVWSLDVSLTPTDADDYFFYIKNTGTTDLGISDFRISSTVATEIAIEKVTGTVVGGTELPLIARNLGSSRVPSATIESGVSLTGLTKVGRLFFMELDTVDRLYHLSTSSNIIIPQGASLAIKRVAATGLINATISLVGAD